MAVYISKDGWGYSCKSTDDKPTDPNIPDMTPLWEFDTKKAFVYSRLNINPATGNGWWEV